MGTLFVDAETDGLYGQFLSVAAIVLNDTGEEVDTFYGTIRKPENIVSSEWVKENVLPYLRDGIRSDADLYDAEDEMVEAFYDFYSVHAECDVIADVPYPVESRLFIKIVWSDPEDRMYKLPFPLMDLSSMLYARGYQPLCDRREITDCSDLRLHNALDDVRMSIRVWEKIKEEGR